MSGGPSALRDGITGRPLAAGFAALCGLSLLALGGNFHAPLGALTVLAALLAALARAPRTTSPGPRRLLWALQLAAGICVLQLIPWPHAWLQGLAPAHAEVWSAALAPFGDEGPTLRTLSLDPGATFAELSKVFLYGCALWTALALVEQRDGGARLERLLLWLCASVSLLSLSHWLLSQHAVLGVYTPEFTRDPRRMSVLLNANHLAEVMAMGSALASGALLRPHAATRARLEASLCLLSCLGGAALASSRGGWIALLCGVLVCLGSAKLRGRRAAIAASLSLAAGVLAISLIAWHEPLRTETTSTDLEKLSIFRQSLPLLARYGSFGVGRGAFEAVSPEARRDLDAYVFTHPENLVLQWTIESGLVLGLAWLGLVAWACWPGTLRRRRTPQWGAFAALAAFALQNQVDFGSEMPAIVLLAIGCFALAFGGGPLPERVAPARRRALWGWSAAALLIGVATLARSPYELWSERRALSQRAQGEPDAQFLPALRAAMSRHPAEAHFAYLGAVYTDRHTRGSVAPWVERALQRSPIHGRAHLLLARELHTRQPAQARLEYRLALIQDARTLPSYRLAVSSLVHDLNEAEQMLPRETELLGAMPSAASLTLHVPPARRALAQRELITALWPRRPATATRLLRDALDDAPHSAELSALWAEPLGRDVLDDAPHCGLERARCRELAEQAARQWVQNAPRDARAHALLGRLLAARDPALAEKYLQEQRLHVEEPAELLLAEAHLAQARGDGEHATELLEQAERRCLGPEACRRLLLAAMRFEAQRKLPERALLWLRKLTELRPGDAALWRQRAQAAEQLGLRNEALDAYREGSRLAPGDAGFKAALERMAREPTQAPVGTRRP